MPCGVGTYYWWGEIWGIVPRPDGVIAINHRFAEIWEIREILRVSVQEIAIFGDFL